MPTPVRFWVDPICPWCWTTSQWIRRIADEKDLQITWEPISLLVKNDAQPDSPWYDIAKWSYGLLRVLEKVRAEEGEAAVGALYLEYGRRIHHDGENQWDVAIALKAAGLDEAYAAAFDDESLDEESSKRRFWKAVQELGRWYSAQPPY